MDELVRLQACEVFRITRVRFERGKMLRVSENLLFIVILSEVQGARATETQSKDLSLFVGVRERGKVRGPSTLLRFAQDDSERFFKRPLDSQQMLVRVPAAAPSRSEESSTFRPGVKKVAFPHGRSRSQVEPHLMTGQRLPRLGHHCVPARFDQFQERFVTDLVGFDAHLLARKSRRAGEWISIRLENSGLRIVTHLVGADRYVRVRESRVTFCVGNAVLDP